MSKPVPEFVAAAKAAIVQLLPTVEEPNLTDLAFIVADVMAYYLDPLFAQERGKCCDAVRRGCLVCKGTGYEHGLQCEYCGRPINAIEAYAEQAKMPEPKP